MFVAHWVNNAFSGAALEGGTKGIFINILNRFQTGSYFQTSPAPGRARASPSTTLSHALLEALAAFFPAAEADRQRADADVSGGTAVQLATG